MTTPPHEEPAASDQPDTDEDPTEWPNNKLINRYQLARLLETPTWTIRYVTNAPGFPKHKKLGGSRGTTPLWRVADIRKWEQTHCLYTNHSRRCTNPRTNPDPDQLGLCPTHHKQARQILRRKDKQHD